MLFTRTLSEVSTNDVANISQCNLINAVNCYTWRRVREQQKCRNGRRDCRLQGKQLLLCFPVLNQVLVYLLNTIGNLIALISYTSRCHILKVMNANLLEATYKQEFSQNKTRISSYYLCPKHFSQSQAQMSTCQSDFMAFSNQNDSMIPNYVYSAFRACLHPAKEV